MYPTGVPVAQLPSGWAAGPESGHSGLVQAWERKREQMSPLCAQVSKVGVYIFAPPDSQLPWKGRDLPQVAEQQCSVGIILFVGLCSAIKNVP